MRTSYYNPIMMLHRMTSICFYSVFRPKAVWAAAQFICPLMCRMRNHTGASSVYTATPSPSVSVTINDTEFHPKSFDAVSVYVS